MDARMSFNGQTNMMRDLRSRRMLLLALALTMALSVVSPISQDGGALFRQISYSAVAIFAFISLRPLVSPERLFVIPLGLVVALLWSAASIFWAIEPGMAARRLILTATIIWTICSAVNVLGFTRTLAVMRIILLVALASNYLAVIIAPSWGIHQAADALDKNLIGDWRGIMMQKNFAGAACSITIICFLFDRRGITPWLRFAIIGAATFFLVKSGSRTSLIGCLGAVGVGVMYLGYNARYRMILLPLAAFIVFVVSSLTNIFYVRDPWQFLQNYQSTLSGRVAIWEMVWRYSMDNRLLGAGYGSFWNIGNASPVYEYGKGWLLELASGHNGYLDLLATIGIPGLAIVVVGAIVLPLLRLLTSESANGPPGALLFALIIFGMAHNSSESSLFDRDSLTWLFMVVAIALTRKITQKNYGHANSFTPIFDEPSRLREKRAVRRSAPAIQRGGVA
ncbi:O-antigen ligase [soil metagenome]